MRQDYGRRIARAMAHVAADLARTPRLQELAVVTAFSPCRVHRVYRAVAGETPAAEYRTTAAACRRRRV